MEAGAAPPRTILVVDVGGTSIKLRASDWSETVRVPSGPLMGPHEMIAAVRAALAGRRYDVVSLGYPGPVTDGRPARDPKNLAPGWTAFDYEAAFGAPVRALNDAALQALGNYRGGRMLFLGYGTGLGSAVIAEGTVLPLELAHLPYRRRRTYEQYTGAAARARLGDARWRRFCLDVACRLRDAMQVHDVTLGGGNARRLAPVPEGMRFGERDAAFAGGLALWIEPAALRVPRTAPPGEG